MASRAAAKRDGTQEKKAGAPAFSLVLSATGFEGGFLEILSTKRERFEPCTTPTSFGIPKAAPRWC